MVKHSLVLTILAVVSIAADEPKKAEFDTAARNELNALEGEWTFVSMETKDGKHELSDGESITLSIDGTKWTFGSLQDGEVVGLDPSTNPKLVDLKNVRKGREDTINEAVYKLEKEMLAICIYQGKNKKRPTSTEEVGDGKTLWVLKRVKK